jgi:beta-lactamase class D
MLSSVLASACARSARDAPAAVVRTQPGAERRVAEVVDAGEPGAAGLATVPAPELAALLGLHGVRGAIALLEGDAMSVRCSDVDTCRTRLVPASTFKIPNSMIGLETGVIVDAEFVIPWDGVKRSIEAWNRDHSLRSAIRDSVVPYYQELARRVGLPRMREWVQQLGYGNRQIGDVVDQFWLEGPLAISPLEQLEFLRRLAREELPISARTRSIVLEILVRGELDGGVLRGKTGWAAPGTPEEVGWFVGFLQTPRGFRYVAVALLDPPDSVDMQTLRPALAEAALRTVPVP